MTSAAAPDFEPQIIHAGMLPVVDLRCMSQSELYALSRCDASSYDPLRSDDVVIPKIDRRVFKESAASLKQMYSRLRLAPAGSSSSKPHFRHGGGVPHQYLGSEPENQKIVSLIKRLAGLDSEELVSIPVEYSASEPDIAERINSTVSIVVEQCNSSGC